MTKGGGHRRPKSYEVISEQPLTLVLQELQEMILEADIDGDQQVHWRHLSTIQLQKHKISGQF